MKPYVLLKVGKTDYRLKITTAAAIELEDKLNCSVVDGMNRLNEARVLVKYIYAAARELNDGIASETDAAGILDEYYMQGNKFDDIFEVVLEVMENSGYITQQQVDITKKMNAQLKEKQAQLLSI